MISKPPTTFELGPMDAAIVLREDGGLEVAIPELSDEEVIPENVITGAALMFALQSPKIFEIIHEHFLEECATMEMQGVNDD